MIYYKKIIFSLAIIVVLITAIFSTGYHHFDEHYQILEFANFKNGLTTQQYLPWEYNSQIRPTLQPTIALVIIKSLQLFNINSPFYQAMFIRILIGLFSIFTINLLINTLIVKVKEKNRLYFILLSWFLFFIPYLAVRFSSETLSANFFLIGLSLTLKYYSNNKNEIRQHQNLLIGIVLGLSFVVRYQSAFLIIGLLAWLLIIKKIQTKNILNIIAGMLISTSFGILIDYWYYQQWTITAWNYFKINIIDNKASSFGVHPWYFYFKPKHIVGLLFLPAFSIFFIKHYKSPITFSLVPFILVHLFIGHKELRFLFPISFLIPFILIQTITFIQEKLHSTWIKKLVVIILLPLLLFNCFMIIIKMITPADGGIMVYKYIDTQYKDQEINIYYLSEASNFYNRQGNLIMNFYDTKKFMMHKESLIKKEDIDKLDNAKPTLIITNSKIFNSSLDLEYSVLPDWIKKIDPHNFMRINNANWLIYKLTKNPS